MDEKIKNTLAVMGGLLAEMTDRTERAEKTAKDSCANSDYWFNRFSAEEAKCRELEKKLDETLADLKDTQEALRDALDTVAKKGKTDNEKGQNK